MIGLCNNQGDLEFFLQEVIELVLVVWFGVGCIVEGWLLIYVLGLQCCQQCEYDGLCCVVLIFDLYYGVGMMEYMCLIGGWVIMLECGQYFDLNGFEVVCLVILCMLVFFGMFDEGVVKLYWFV